METLSLRGSIGSLGPDRRPCIVGMGQGGGWTKETPAPPPHRACGDSLVTLAQPGQRRVRSADWVLWLMSSVERVGAQWQ